MAVHRIVVVKETVTDPEQILDWRRARSSFGTIGRA